MRDCQNSPHDSHSGNDKEEEGDDPVFAEFALWSAHANPFPVEGDLLLHITLPYPIQNERVAMTASTQQ